MNYQQANSNKIMECISGSHAYGTETPESDKDYRGIFIAPLYYMLGLDVVEQVNKPNEDSVLFEIRKYIKLASECNPNIIELLFTDDRFITFRNKYYDKLRQNNKLFLSKKARHTFSGYAIAQLHRIKSHKKYLLNPPTHIPCREEFELPIDNSLIPADQRNALLSLPDDFIKPELKEYVLKEKKFRQALDHYNSYKEWELKRNPARKAIEHKYGYDCKHGTHLVRLIFMGREILTKGTLTVYMNQEQREILKDIRSGKWSYDKLLEFADEIDLVFEELEKKSTLPFSVDRPKIRNLLIEILSEAYNVDLSKTEINL